MKLAIYSYSSQGSNTTREIREGKGKAQQERDLLIQHGFRLRDGDGGSENAMLVFGSVS